MYWLVALAGLGAWMALRKPAPKNVALIFGNPSPSVAAPTLERVANTSGIAIADDCSWVIEGVGFLPPVGSALYVPRPEGAPDLVQSIGQFNSAWPFVVQMLGNGATPQQAAEAIIVEAPYDLTDNAQHCGQVAALSPAMVAWRASLAQRIGSWQWRR